MILAGHRDSTERTRQDKVLLIYLQDALPKEYVYLLTGVDTMEEAWTRLEDRFGDSNQRVLAIYSKLAALDLKGKEYERLERMHFEVEHAVSLMSSAGASHHFSQDLYIVATLLSKLAPASVEKWNEFTEYVLEKKILEKVYKLI